MIGDKFRAKVKEAIEELLDGHIEQIKEAYIQSETGVNVAIPIRIQPNAKISGFIDVSVGIRFVRLKTKENILLHISEAQDPLFTGFKDPRLAGVLKPRKGSGIDSVKITQHPSGKSVELRAKD